MVPGSTLMYGSSFTIATLRPRASRIAPREAEAMPLPNEDTTPPVTNTKRLMKRSGFPSRPSECGSAAAVSTGEQISRPGGRFEALRSRYRPLEVPPARGTAWSRRRLRPAPPARAGARGSAVRVRRSSMPDEAPASPLPALRAHGCIDPKIRRGEQPIARPEKRNSSAVGVRHPRLLQQRLEQPPRSPAPQPQPLAAAAEPYGEGLGNDIEVERTVRVQRKLQAAEPCGKLERALPRVPLEVANCDVRHIAIIRALEAQAIPLATSAAARPAHLRVRIRTRRDQRAGELCEPARIGERMAPLNDPVPEGVAPAILGQRAQMGDGQRVRDRSAFHIDAREQIEQPLGLGGVARSARDGAARSGPASAQQRGDAAAQIIAIEALVRVRRILDPFERVLVRPGLELRALDLEQWACDPSVTEWGDCRHRRKPAQPRAAQQLQQNRLELIVGMLCGQ